MLDRAASISIYSETRTAAEVTERLSLQPTGLHEIGDTRRSRPEPFTFSFWGYTVRDAEAAHIAPDDDTAGFASLDLLLHHLKPHFDPLKALRADYDLVISWYGNSGSYQGGFVLPVRILRLLVELDCDLYGNVYPFDDPDGDQD